MALVMPNPEEEPELNLDLDEIPPRETDPMLLALSDEIRIYGSNRVPLPPVNLDLEGP